ncbi:hypothetical protein F0L74_00185 [Chitinophaga agrisoli]|uniref:DUF6249 domain-containing protein n=1 Tax=Chitinophaga agrisoli TaxID=2607653 RepID=A0A5B2VYG1_9BACT|nr:DUF6249 domain-containing protein [Chitinophaga agrisoli]KAA2244441.1 hypothetical protein F0L74_00185 [Chitinophaga agrisoli]
MLVTSAALLIAVALVVFGISYYYFTTRHRERMTLLEKGLAPDYFKGTGSYLSFVLILGVVSIGISLGILTGSILQSVTIRVIRESAFPASIFLFLGISLLVSYYLLSQIQNKRK